MALMICPDCGNECSTSAESCPHCGRPFAKPKIAPKVIVREVPVEKEFPRWIFVPLAILFAVVAFFAIVYFRQEDETANRNINVKVSTTPVTTARVNSSETTVVTSTPDLYASSINSSSTTSSTVVQGNSVAVAPPSDKGVMTMEAKVINRGSTQPVSKETFYLLDKDLQSILSEAAIEDPEGQGVVNAFGLSVINPQKYREVNQKALAAINRHIVYRTLTDATGKAEIKDIKPDSYYLFGITKTRNGFAVWDSPVTIQPGQNNIVLEPSKTTEVAVEN